MKIKITGDSTCDLSKELIEKYDVAIMPLHVLLGETDYLDDGSVTPEDIYKLYADTKTLPKSGAVNTEYYKEEFKKILDSGYDAIIHFNISDSMSVTHQNAKTAAKNFKNVFVVDSANLSTGTGLQMIAAYELAQTGLPAKQVYEKTLERVSKTQASFVVDDMEFLYKGGRCSSLAYLGANLLAIKPRIEVIDGAMGVQKKYMGKFDKVIKKYIDDILIKYNTPDKTRCFVTHTKMRPGVAEAVIEQVKSYNIFDEVLETTAGCTITTHCGEGTLGLLYINDGDEVVDIEKIKEANKNK